MLNSRTFRKLKFPPNYDNDSLNEHIRQTRSKTRPSSRVSESPSTRAKPSTSGESRPTVDLVVVVIEDTASVGEFHIDKKLKTRAGSRAANT